MDNAQTQNPPFNLYGLNELGYTILLDRYSQKDHDRSNIKPDDIVIAILDNDKPDMKQRREVGRVLSINDNVASVLLMRPNTPQTIDIDINLLDRCLDQSPQDVWERVSTGVSSIENVDKRSVWKRNFDWLLSDWRFIPGGRILTSAGTDQDLTLLNCFVIPSPNDSRGGIMKTLTQMAELMSRGGGVGINLSTLRPKNSYVKGVNGRSSGSVSWGALFSFVTGLIEQAGSRRRRTYADS